MKVNPIVFNNKQAMEIKRLMKTRDTLLAQIAVNADKDFDFQAAKSRIVLIESMIVLQLEFALMVSP